MKILKNKMKFMILISKIIKIELMSYLINNSFLICKFNKLGLYKFICLAPNDVILKQPLYFLV